MRPTSYDIFELKNFLSALTGTAIICRRTGDKITIYIPQEDLEKVEKEKEDFIYYIEEFVNQFYGFSYEIKFHDKYHKVNKRSKGV